MQIHLSKSEDLILQNATPLRNQRLDLLTCLMDVSCTATTARHASLQTLFKRPTPAIAFEHATKHSCFAHFWQGAESTAPGTQNHILTDFQKWSETVSL